MRRSVLFTLIASLIAIALLTIISLRATSIKPEENSSASRQDVKFKDYHLQSFNLTIKIPETTRVTGDDYHDDEVIFNAYLEDESLKFKGYIQLWKVADLEKFLETNKSISPFKFATYSERKVEIKSLTGYQVDWTAIFQEQRPVSGKEYFLKQKDGEEVLRVSLFADESPFPKHLEQTAVTMTSSIEWD